MDIPIELFLGFTGVSIVLAILGFLRQPQIPATIVMGGMFILVLSVATTNIILGQFTSPDGITSIIAYDVISRTGQDDIRTGFAEIQAQFVSTSSSMLIGDNVNCATWHIKKNNSPDTNTIVRYGVWDNSAVPQLKYTFGTMNVTAVPTTVQPITHCNNDSTYTIVQNDRIGISWNDGNATSRLTVDVDTTNPYDSTITFNTRFNGATWVANTGTDMQGKLFLQSGESAITINETYEFTELPKTLFALIGVMIMLVGGLMVMRD